MSKHDEWQTPPELFLLLDDEFGFDMDAAATKDNTMLPEFISPEQDALVTTWPMLNVWCNPPYTMIPAFVHRAWDQCQEQQNVVVMLLPAYTDTKYWWEVIIPHADEVRFLKGRVSFRENGLKKTSARFPSVVVVFRYRGGEQQKSAHCWWWNWK